MATPAWVSILSLVVLSIFLGFLAFNASQLQSHQIRFSAPMSRQAKAIMDGDNSKGTESDPLAWSKEGALKRLSKALQYPTISHHLEEQNNQTVWNEFFKFLEESYPWFHSKLTREKVAGACEHTRLYKWQGHDSSLKPYLLLAHTDVVPVEEGTEQDWSYPPFGGVEAEGYIWGRGALDMKAPLMSMLEAVEHLLNRGFKPRRTAYFSFGHDEEVGGASGNALVKEHFEYQGIQFEFVLDEGGAIVAPGMIEGLAMHVAAVGIAEKGMMSVQLEVELIGGHAATPPPETPIGILSHAISSLESNPMRSSLSGVFTKTLEHIAPELPYANKVILSNLWFFGWALRPFFFDRKPATAASIRTTIAPTMLRAGTKENVLAKKATGIVNVRILPGDSINSVMQYISDTINDPRVRISIYRNISFEPSGISSTKSPGWHLLKSTIAQVFPKIFITPYLTTQATDSRYYGSVSDSVYRFMPFRLDRHDLQRIHGTNERVATKDFVEMVAFMTQLIQNAQTPPAGTASHSHDEL